jgi:Flp pilus assembly protein TadD
MWEIIIFLATIVLAIMLIKKLPVDLVSDEKGAEKESDKEKSLRERADEHIEAGELRKAEHILLRIIAAEPDDASTYNKLGMIYLQEKNFKDARSSLKQALKLEPDNDTFHNNLGLLSYQRGDYDDAIEAYEKSIEIDNKIPSRLVNLGMAYFMSKKYRKAADQFEKALILDPRNESYADLLKQAEEKLA